MSPSDSAHDIAYVIGGLGRGGAERQLLELCTELDPQRFRPTVFALGAGHPFANAFVERGVAVVALPRRGSWDSSRLRGLRSNLRRLAPAVVHSFLPAPGRYARLACLGLHSRPAMVTSERSAGGVYTAAERLVDLALAGQTDRFVVNAGPVRDALARRLRPRRPRIDVIHNGFDPKRIDAAAPRAATRRALGWDDTPVILFVGSLKPAKDLPTLIRAFAGVVARRTARLVVAGEGRQRALLERAATEQGLPITLLGDRDDVPDLLRAADLLAMSSHTEGLPNVVAEALLAELPVAATAAGGVTELLDDGVHGRIVPVGDAEALAAALLELLAEPERARALARAGSQRMRREFSVAAMVERSQALYAELLAAKP